MRNRTNAKHIRSMFEEGYIVTYQYKTGERVGLWHAWIGPQRMAKYAPTKTEDEAIEAAFDQLSTKYQYGIIE